MKRLIAIFAAVSMATASLADEPDAMDEEALLAAVCRAANWTPDELRAGLAMLDRMWIKDHETRAGRVKWHGRCVLEALDEERRVKVETYEDGYVFEIPMRPRPSAHEDAEAADAGLPERLREARAARRAAATNNTVTVVVEANKPPAEDE